MKMYQIILHVQNEAKQDAELMIVLDILGELVKDWAPVEGQQMGIKLWKEGRKGGRQMSGEAGGMINGEEGTSEQRRRRSADLAPELLASSHLLICILLLFL